MKEKDNAMKTLPKLTLHYFSVLHFKLRSLDFAQKILDHLVAGVKVWSDTSNLHDIRFLGRAMKECIDKIRGKTGILMDLSCGSGCSTNTRPLGDRFFSPINRSDIYSLIRNEGDKELFYLLSTNKYPIISYTSSQRQSCSNRCCQEFGHWVDATLEKCILEWFRDRCYFHYYLSCSYNRDAVNLSNILSVIKVNEWNRFSEIF